MYVLSENEKPGFFKDFFKTVRQAITNDQFNLFSKLTTDEERIRFVFDLPSVHEISIRTFYKGKSEKEALERKEAGNRVFGRKKNAEALKLYSQAVVKAPVPVGKYWKLIKENADPKKMTLYAICLANRSAALFHMQEIYYCVQDIEEALAHHYPKELKYKLFKRKARLLMQLKRHEDARDGFRQALKWLDWAKMDREKRIQTQKDIQKWLGLFVGGGNVKNAEMTTWQLFPHIPPVAEGENEQFPSLSKKVEIRYTKDSGRFAVAAEDIKVGDIICTEKPYAAVLAGDSFGTHCQTCFLVTKAPIPCKTCSGVLFCSARCRDSAYFHSIECQIMDLLIGSGMSINCFLALRMLTQSPIAYFLNIKDQLNEEDPKDLLEKSSKVSSGDFLQIYGLVRHAERRTPEDFFHRTVMVAFLVKALKKTKYFDDKGSTLANLMKEHNGDKLSDAEAFAGGLLNRFLQIVQFNAHEVSEFSFKTPKSFDGSKNDSIGAAIYPSLALFNHSCNTAMNRYFSGNQVVTQAVRQVKKGEIVPENYGSSFTSKNRSERKLYLADRYWFECACEACRDDWPLFKDMETNILVMKCHKCDGPIPVNITSNQPFHICNKCGDQTNILSALKNLTNTENTFKAAMKEMTDFNVDKSMDLLSENINQLEACLYPPYKDYHLTQEAYMRCGLSKGNTIVKPDAIEEKKDA